MIQQSAERQPHPSVKLWKAEELEFFLADRNVLRLRYNRGQTVQLLKVESFGVWMFCKTPVQGGNILNALFFNPIAGGIDIQLKTSMPKGVLSSPC
jgi:hypothetical protein